MANTPITEVKTETNLQGILLSSLSTTGLSVQAQFVDNKTGVSRAPQSDTLLFTLDKDNSNAETILATSHSTVSGVTTITIAALGRNIPKFGVGAGSGTGNSHFVGSEIGCVDVARPLNILAQITTEKLNLSGGTMTGAATIANYFDAAARDAAITVPANGMEVYLITEGVFTDYTSGAWVTRAAGATPNASETVAGKVELATNAEMGLGTSTGGTGARLVPPNDQLVQTSSGAADANKLATLGATGKLDTGFIPQVNPQILVAGESIAQADALYVKASDGKAYRAIATPIGETSDSFIGFANAATLVGANVTVQTGAYVTGFSGLVAGSTYFLTNVAGAISTTPGTIAKPVLIATSATTGILFPTQGSREIQDKILPSAIPTINTNTTTTVTTGFRPKWIDVELELGAKDSAGGNVGTKTFQARFNGTTLIGGTYVETVTDGITFRSTGIISGTQALAGIYTVLNAVEINNPANNYSKITFTIDSISNTGFVFKLTNVTTLGTGSNNVGCSTVTYRVKA